MATFTVTHTSGSLEGETALIVPLTSIWTPGCGIPVDLLKPTSCLPPLFESVWGRVGYYSPAQCPSGYEHGCTRTTMDEWHDLPIYPGETVVSCVPSGWDCVTTSPTFMASSPTPGGATYAPAIEIRWKEDDIPLFERFEPVKTVTVSSPSSPAPSNDDKESSNPRPTASSSLTVPQETSLAAIPGPTQSEGESSSQMTIGVIIGIAVAGSIVLLAIAGASLFLFLHRRAKRRKALTASGAGPGAVAGEEGDKSPTASKANSTTVVGGAVELESRYADGAQPVARFELP